MATIVFDFDSTLVPCESLDELLARALAEQPERVAEIRAITEDGMEGRIPFRESVERRLALAQPTRAEAEELGTELESRIVPGMEELIQGLRAEVWIASGGLREVLLPVAKRLGVSTRRVLGTRVSWSAAGLLERVVECGGKVEQLQPRSAAWARPRIMVGDGMTDHAVFAEGLVDHFAAFTGIARREAVVATGAPEAASVRELEYLLASWL
ncbi:MAG: HAD-IB family phosphatase [Planctomycetota bacterium]